MPDRILRVADSVYQIRGTCRSYLLVHDDATLVIDPGDGDWLEELALLGVKRVDWVLLTHASGPMLWRLPPGQDVNKACCA